jgi:hypothetical protein
MANFFGISGTKASAALREFRLVEGIGRRIVCAGRAPPKKLITGLVRRNHMPGRR